MDYDFSSPYYNPFCTSLAAPPLASIQVPGDLSSYGNSNPMGVSSKRPKLQINKDLSQTSQQIEDTNLDKKPSPFSPECSIPLPFQLGDDYYGPTAIWKRNERERHRVRCVNEGYDKLRNHLPNKDKDRRLSKVETLRLAIRYIHHLEMLLADDNHYSECQCQLTVPNSNNDNSDS